MKIEEYVEGESIESWIERFEFVLTAKKVTLQQLKRAELCASVGQNVFNRLRDTLAPTSIAEVGYATLLETLREQYQRTCNKYQARFKFSKRNRGTNESFNDYFLAIKRLSGDCQFGGSLEERLVERMICGIDNEEVTRRLISEEDLKLTRCMTIINTYESLMQNDFRTRTVNLVERAPRTQQGYKCFRCLGQHRADECKFKQHTCFKCKKVGHLQAACRSSSNNMNQNNRQTWPNTGRSTSGQHNLQQTHPSRRTHLVASENEESWRTESLLQPSSTDGAAEEEEFAVQMIARAIEDL